MKLLDEKHNHFPFSQEAADKVLLGWSLFSKPPIKMQYHLITVLLNFVEFGSTESKTHRNNFEILLLVLWDSTRIVSMLLQKVVSTYQHIVEHFTLPFFPPLNPFRVYNVLLLFQCLFDHPETRGKFVKAKMPNYFYPLMDIGLTDKPHECLRLGALCVIANLLKPLDGAAICFLMDTSAFSYYVKPVEFGSTESKTLNVFIFHKIMSIDEGFQYCCVLADRFFCHR